MEFTYTDTKVLQVSDFLQTYMNKNNLSAMSADECADVLAAENILPNNVGPKPAFNFREMLRQSRDGVIRNKVEGVYQKRPGTRWIIKNIEAQ